MKLRKMLKHSMELDLDILGFPVSVLILIFIIVRLEKTFGQFDRLCDFLKTHRITCEHLYLAIRQRSNLTKEECGILLNIVKPQSVHLNSILSNRYEALFQSKTMVSIIF